MPPIRLVNSIHEAFKNAIPNVRRPRTAFPVTVHPLQPLRQSPPLGFSVLGQHVQAGRTSTAQHSKKFPSRILRESRFSDHGISASFKKAVRHRDRDNAIAHGLPSFPPVQYQTQPPILYQPPVPQPLSSSRRMMREKRFAEKHMGVPLAIYHACKAINAPRRPPAKSVERHGRETHRSRLVARGRYGIPFCGTERRAAFMQPRGRFTSNDVDMNAHVSSGTPQWAGLGLSEMELPSPMKDILPALSQDPVDEMEEVIPAPLMYAVAPPVTAVSQTAPSVQMEEVIPAPLVYATPLSEPAPPVRSPPFVQPPPVQGPSVQPPVHPIQPPQHPSTMSSFCRNLGRVSNEMAYVLRALRGINARERTALPPTTPAALRTRASMGRNRTPQPPMKARPQARLPYARAVTVCA